jgi:hypothetical protein
MKLIAVLCALALVSVCSLGRAQDAPSEPSSPGVAAVSPAGPDMFNSVPVMFFGVHTCGQYVIWLTYANGNMRRIDPQHKPLDMKQFMKTLEDSKIPGDVVTVACTGASL